MAAPRSLPGGFINNSPFFKGASGRFSRPRRCCFGCMRQKMLRLGSMLATAGSGQVEALTFVLVLCWPSRSVSAPRGVAERFAP